MIRVRSLRRARRTSARAAVVVPLSAGAAGRPARAEPLERRMLLAVFTVTTTADDGPGSLRQAIVSANAAAGSDQIMFNIPGAGVHTIAPLSPLPEVTGPTDLNAKSQPGNVTTAPFRPLIELDGSSAGEFADGLVLSATTGGSSVRGFVINRFGRHGILSTATTSVAIDSNYIGTDATGQLGLGNRGAGLVMQGPGVVGGARTNNAATKGNVISGNGFAGVWVTGASSGSVSLQGNYIGTDAAGVRALANGREGVLVEGGGAINIGGTSLPSNNAANVISGNASSGIRLASVGTGPTSPTIRGNFIGTDATGARAIPNGTSPLLPYHDGITSQAVNGLRIGGSDTGQRNVISGNVGAGVSIRGGTNPIVQGNYIGTDSTGNADVGNGGDGITLVQANLTVQGNVLSGNGGDGVHAEALPDITNLMVIGNFIGTNATATGAVGNDGDGVELVGPVRGTVGGATPPIGIFGQPLSPTASGRNVISANGGSGVALAGPATFGSITVAVVGNYIGTDFTGNARLGNRGDGVRFNRPAGIASPITGNLISGNGGNGMLILNAAGATGRGSAIGGNYIGTNAAGNAPLGNSGNGIELRSSTGVGIGGPTPGIVVPLVINPAGTGRNIISANAGHGILIAGNAPEGSGSTGGDLITSNYIGTDATGSIALGNGGSGIHISGGSGHQIGETNQPNVISGNGGDGITIVGPIGTGQFVVTNIRVFGNRIGTDAAGSDAVNYLGNAGHGVAVYNSPGNHIGDDSTVRGHANTIAFNGASGIAVEGTAGNPGSADANEVLGNSIFSNGGLGIDLVYGYEGVTPNDPKDADLGPNRLQNFPIISRATAVSSVTTYVRYTLSSEPSRTYRLEFFAGPQPDPSGNGEGKTYLGTTQVMTNAAGAATGSMNLPGGIAAGSYVTATATPMGGGASAGSTSEFSPAVQAAGPDEPNTVVGRFVFYNQSKFDQFGATANASDDNAVAADKQALLPGQGPATFVNYTSYINGINGVMIDVNGLPTAQTPTASDFGFRVGRDGEDGTFNWTEGPAPTAVIVRRGAGVNGSDRVSLVWRNFNPADPTGLPMAVADGWLEVTVRATAATGLAKPDVFYFGNLRGDTGAGDSPGADRATVNALDLAAVRSHPVVADAPVTNPYDVTRDGTVGALDRAAIRANLFHSLRLIMAPTAPAKADAVAAAQPFATALVASMARRAGDAWWRETSDASDPLV